MVQPFHLCRDAVDRGGSHIERARDGVDRSEVEDIWLEVATEKGELVAIPFNRETETPAVEPLNTDAA